MLNNSFLSWPQIKSLLRTVSRWRAFGPIMGLITLCILLWIATPHFLTVDNLLNVILQSTFTAIIAIGMTFVILTAGIDLSVGSILALVGVVLASLLHTSLPLPLVLIIALLVGTACGLINGLLVSWGKLPPFIVTLGMMSVARGLAVVYTSGSPISGFDKNFLFLAHGKLLGIPLPIYITIVLFFMAYFVLSRMRFGRHTYAVGSNETAAHLTGINVRVVKASIYALSGFTCAIAAILLTARLNSGGPQAGLMYELDAIAATVIGGTSLMGGEGSIWGTLVGAFIIQVLRNGLNLMEISSNFQGIVIGSVIIMAAMLDTYLKSRREH